jgi:hypothetical protein
MDSVNFLNVEYLFARIINAFHNFDYVWFINGVIHILKIIAPYLIAYIVFLLYIIVYSHIRTHQIEHAEHEKYKTLPPQPAPEAGAGDNILHTKWQQVQKHINSTSPGDWRLAILEADIMLAEVLERQGYRGITIGDKLKSANKGDFKTLDQAWAAHRVRNQIAHEGNEFQLTERDAKGTIELFKTVFEEFYHL